MLVLMLLTLPSRARLTSVWMPDLKGTVLQAVVRRLPVLVELCAVQRVDSCNCGNNPPCSARGIGVETTVSGLRLCTKAAR